MADGFKTVIDRQLDDVFLNAIQSVGEIIKERSFKAMEILLDETHPYGTPKDTGWCKSNWRMSLNKPIDRDVAISATPAEVSASETQQEANMNVVEKELSSESATPSNNWYVKDYLSVWLTNNTPYINTLNAGNNKRGAVNFIENAVREAEGK